MKFISDYIFQKYKYILKRSFNLITYQEQIQNL